MGFKNPGPMVLNRHNGLYLPPPTAALSLIQTNLISEFRFDEGSGQVLTDYKGGYNGQLGSTSGSDTNDPTWTASGLDFVTNDSVLVTTSAANDGTGGFTAFVVFRWDTTTGARYLFDRRTTGGSGRDMQFWIDSSGVLSAFGAGVLPSTSSGAITAGTYYLAIVRFIPSTALQIWLGNGSTLTKVAEVTSSVNAARVKGDLATFGGTTIGGNYLDGEMNYLATYDTNLSDANMQANYVTLQAIMTARGKTI